VHGIADQIERGDEPRFCGSGCGYEKGLEYGVGDTGGVQVLGDGNGGEMAREEEGEVLAGILG